MENNEKYDIPFANRNRNDEELSRSRALITRLRVCLAVCAVMALIIGWVGGSIMPIPGTGEKKEELELSQILDPTDKINAILKIMTSEWYFGKDIEGLNERLTDQAMYGITLNDEDPHTVYMSAKEMEEFTQSINRSFVGIGVEFFANGGLSIVKRVFRGSPAESAGIKAGDIFQKVDGVPVDGLTTDEIKELVVGEEGTPVVIEFTRQGEPVSFEIVRGQINASTYGEILDDNIGYIQLYQFGNTTSSEIDSYLEYFQGSGCEDLIIDLRGNGGGYLDALQKIASRFLPKDTVIMQQEYRDGTVELTKSSGNNLVSFDQIIILIDENTASASEVMALAFGEQMDNVTLMGTKTYGKGTVQISRMFKDNSAIKYTTSKWLSPSGVWVNETEGIEPDVEVRQHDAWYVLIEALETELHVDNVAPQVRCAQIILDYLGYEIDRTDGYFSPATEEAVRAFRKDHDLEDSGVLDPEVYEAIISAATLDMNTNPANDVQLQKALEVLHE